MYLVVNLKTYREGTGRHAKEIAEAAAQVQEETGVRVAVAAQASDIHRASQAGAETLAQHVDPVEPGSNTGSTLAEAVREAGASGTLINHSEHRLKLADIDGALRAAERADLETIVCANNPRQSAAVDSLEPDYVAVEPPELIGSGTPVSQADPDVVRDAAEVVENAELLCGAGISSGRDVEAALNLGAEGVLVASGVVKAGSPREAMLDLVGGVD